ncbi:S1C family serine protease [Porphyrobacter sp. ULC335]|uniref:S1C family serine protease n=1 Tax=Porphyrobacter sp. ULC335 TaxID=2854260 RepID=UPI0022210EE3|nr:serine protease [Porphyrobacter sp. ULC335]UYV16518.1 serine protease [Porphyrobacter sp. ULC335]
MQPAQPGQRIAISPKADCRIRLEGPEGQRIAIAAIGTGGGQGGRVLAFERIDPQHWFMGGMAELEGDFEIVAYVMDDRHGGFTNAAYPIHFEVDGTTHVMPPPTEQLAAVILAEIYTRNGERRMKVANEGFTFGIDAYVRARNLGEVEVPYRNAPSVPPPGNGPIPHPDGRGHNRPKPVPGQMLGTGSGVLIAPDLIVTNAHVIEDGQRFEIGPARDVAVTLAVDAQHDLALLRCQTAGAPLPLRIGSPLFLGEDIMAAGFPLIDVLGADLKVTTGNVSGLTGGGGDITRFQFSAPIGSGSSGGAIIDEFGNLVGITSASLAHDNMRNRGSISENVNFGIRAALVFEMAAAAGADLPPLAISTDNLRRNVVGRARNAVVSIIVHA